MCSLGTSRLPLGVAEQIVLGVESAYFLPDDIIFVRILLVREGGGQSSRVLIDLDTGELGLRCDRGGYSGVPTAFYSSMW